MSHLIPVYGLQPIYSFHQDKKPPIVLNPPRSFEGYSHPFLPCQFGYFNPLQLVPTYPQVLDNSQNRRSYTHIEKSKKSIPFPMPQKKDNNIPIDPSHCPEHPPIQTYTTSELSETPVETNKENISVQNEEYFLPSNLFEENENCIATPLQNPVYPQEKFPKLSLLQAAACKGDRERVLKLIKRKVDFYETSFEGRTAMSYAIENGFLSIVKCFAKSPYLINHKAQRTALGDACFYRQEIIATYLLQQGASIDLVSDMMFREKKIEIKKRIDSAGNIIIQQRKLIIPCRKTIRFLCSAGADYEKISKILSDKYEELSKAGLMKAENSAEFKHFIKISDHKS